MRELAQCVRNQLIARERTIVLLGFGGPELPFQLRQQHSSDEVRTGSDQPKVTGELLPRVVVGRDDAELELDVRCLIACGYDPERPRHLDVAVLIESGEGR